MNRFVAPLRLCLVLWLACFGFARGALAATITVTSTGDTVAIDGVVTLREAIESINAGADLSDVIAVGAYGVDDAISFNILGGGLQTITLVNSLPHITKTVILDGFTQPGALFGAPLIEINGSAAVEGVVLNNTVGAVVRGLILNRNATNFPGFVGIGVLVTGAGATNNKVQGNFVGTDPTGTVAVPNTFHGVQVQGGSGNFVGTDGDGVNDEMEGNLISGNMFVGVFLIDATANRVAGNIIGLDVTGTFKLANGTTGVSIDGSSNNIIGTNGDGISDVLERNVVSGFVTATGGRGVRILGGSSAVARRSVGNRVSGNYIGVDATGTLAAPNGFGVSLDGAFEVSANIIGTNGDGAGDNVEGNLISGNAFDGVLLSGLLVTGNRLIGNRIGTDASGLADLGNVGPGVRIQTGSTGNIIGGTAAGHGNVIAYNESGIVVFSTDPDHHSVANVISGNSTFLNDGLGIDLGDDGVTENDPGDVDDGPNRLTNFPVLSGAAIIGQNFIIEGFARPDALLEFFTAEVDGTGFGEGRTFLGAVAEGSPLDSDATVGTYGPLVNGAPVGTDTTNRFRFIVPLALVPPDIAELHLTATSTFTAPGEVNTSEFGNVVNVTQGLAQTTLAVSLSAPPSVVPGTSITYTIATANMTTQPAFEVVVTDVAQPGLIFQSASGVCASGVPCSLGTLGPVGSPTAGVSFTITYLVPATFTAATLDNTASATAFNALIQSATVSTAVTPSADLSLTKTGPASVPAAATIIYTLTVTNAGPSAATGVVLVDPPPDGLTFVSATAPCPAGFPCDLGTVLPGASLVVQATYAVSPTFSGAVVNQAHLTADTPDPTPENAAASVVTVVLSPTTNIAVLLFADTEAPLLGDDVELTFLAVNASDATVTETSLALALPASLRVRTATPSLGTVDIAAGTWTLGPLTPAAAATLTVVAEVADADPNLVAVEVTGAVPPDTVPGDNRAEVALLIYDPFRTVSDLGVTISGPAIVAPGAPALYAVRATNYGSTHAVDQTITVATPPDMTFATVSASFGGVCAAPPPGGAGAVSCAWGGQTVVGAERDVTLTLTAGSVATGPGVAVTATVASGTEDPHVTNNSATALTTITSDPTTADLEVLGAFLPSGLTTLVVSQANLATTFRFQVRNTSGVAVTAGRLSATIKIPDNAPALAITGASVSQGVVDAAAAAWDIGGLAPGAIATMDVTATVTRAVPIQFELRRTASAPADPNRANDLATLEFDVIPVNGGGRYVALANTDGGPTGELLVATGEFESPQIQLFDDTGAREAAFLAYDPRFVGGVRMAACDFDGDGRDEIVTAAGPPGGGPHVRIFRRRDHRFNEVASWYTIDEAYRGGVYVGCGDVDGDAVPEVITGTGAEGPALIQVWKVDVGVGRVDQLIAGALPDIAPGFGIRVAACDVTGDGRAEILGAAVGGSEPIVRIFDLATATLLRTFPAARPGEALGLQVACGDVVPGGGNEILVGLDVGGSSIVRAFTPDGALLGEFMPFAPVPNGGVRVAVGEFDGDPTLMEFVLASSLNAPPQVMVGSARAGVTILLQLVVPEIP